MYSGAIKFAKQCGVLSEDGLCREFQRTPYLMLLGRASN